MDRPRVIPCLLLDGEGLYKTTRFGTPSYVGDPINTIRIFNDKEVDEAVLLNIGAARHGGDPPYDLLRDLAGECFMPLCYGGGVRSTQHFRDLIHLGVEKVAINTAAVEQPQIIEEAAALFGTQSVVVSIDVQRDRDGHARVVTHAGSRPTELDPAAHASRAEELGAGEILLTAVDREGTRSGLDLELVERVSASVGVPVVAHGGAASTQDLRAAVQAGASAVAAGSLFVHWGPERAVLITYPDREARDALFA